MTKYEVYERKLDVIPIVVMSNKDEAIKLRKWLRSAGFNVWVQPVVEEEGRP